MLIFHRTHGKTRLLLSLLLFLSLLYLPGATLHVHNLDHSNAVVEASDHSHLSAVHFAHDTSHQAHHHDGVVSEFDAGSSDGVLKNLSSSIVAFALFALLFVLLLPDLSRQVVRYHRESATILYGHYLLSPPLRAPPSHF